jgi:hypothetical protein
MLKRLALTSFTVVCASTLCQPFAAHAQDQISRTSISVNQINGLSVLANWGWILNGHFPAGTQISDSNTELVKATVGGAATLAGDSTVDVHLSGFFYDIYYNWDRIGTSDTFLKGTFHADAGVFPECTPSLVKCGPIGALARVSVGEEKAQAKVGIVDDPVVIPKGNRVGIGSPAHFNVSIAPSNFQDEVMRVMDLGLSTYLDTSGNSILKADWQFGPSSDQLRSYNVSISYAGQTCTLTSATPDCTNAFLDTISSGFTALDFWSFDSGTKEYALLDDLAMPGFSYEYAGGSSVTNEQSLTVTSGATGQDNDTEQVPGPLPLLGVGVAFGYSRKLRKRIKTRKTPEAISAID